MKAFRFLVAGLVTVVAMATSGFVVTASPTAPGGIVLARDGLGVASFGRSDAEVVSTISGIIGAPTEEFLAQWDPDLLADVGPVPAGVSFPISPIDGELTIGLSSIFQYNRAVAYGTDLAVILAFGGGSLDDLRFVGWFVAAEGFSTPFGLGVGSSLSDYPGVLAGFEYGSAECDTGGAVVGGVGVMFEFAQSGVTFEDFGDSDAEIRQNVDPADFVVSSLEGGSMPDGEGLCAVDLDVPGAGLPATA